MADKSCSRRGFLKGGILGGTALLACALRENESQASTPAAGNFKEDLGFQLYTLRNVLAKGPEKIFRDLAGIGYRKVEVLRNGLDKLGPIMKSAGLEMISGHFDTPIITGNWEPYKKNPAFVMPGEGSDRRSAIAQAQRFGLKYMVVPYLQPMERGDLDVYRRLADNLNAAGEECRKAGMKLCYHHHAFEFKPVSGRPPLDLIMERCDRNLVGLEVDVFWVSVAGLDPVEIFNKYSGRIPLVHLKDKAKETPQEFDEKKVSTEAFKEVGNGVLDFPGILRAAAKAGVEQYFVEQDQCPGDPVTSLQASYQYLRKVAL